MAKIGTAQVEIKPVLNEDALHEIGIHIEDEIRAAVQRAFADLTFKIDPDNRRLQMIVRGG